MTPPDPLASVQAFRAVCGQLRQPVFELAGAFARAELLADPGAALPLLGAAPFEPLAGRSALADACGPGVVPAGGPTRPAVRARPRDPARAVRPVDVTPVANGGSPPLAPGRDGAGVVAARPGAPGPAPRPSAPAPGVGAPARPAAHRAMAARASFGGSDGTLGGLVRGAEAAAVSDGRGGADRDAGRPAGAFEPNAAVRGEDVGEGSSGAEAARALSGQTNAPAIDGLASADAAAGSLLDRAEAALSAADSQAPSSGTPRRPATVGAATSATAPDAGRARLAAREVLTGARPGNDERGGEVPAARAPSRPGRALRGRGVTAVEASAAVASDGRTSRGVAAGGASTERPAAAAAAGLAAARASAGLAPAGGSAGRASAGASAARAPAGATAGRPAGASAGGSAAGRPLAGASAAGARAVEQIAPNLAERALRAETARAVAAGDAPSGDALGPRPDGELGAASALIGASAAGLASDLGRAARGAEQGRVNGDGEAPAATTLAAAPMNRLGNHAAAAARATSPSGARGGAADGFDDQRAPAPRGTDLPGSSPLGDASDPRAAALDPGSARPTRAGTPFTRDDGMTAAARRQLTAVTPHLDGAELASLLNETLVEQARIHGLDVS